MNKSKKFLACLSAAAVFVANPTARSFADDTFDELYESSDAIHGDTVEISSPNGIRSFESIDHRGLRAKLLEGDSVLIEGSTAIVEDASGNTAIEINADLPEDKKLSFNQNEGVIEVVNASSRAKRCTDSKWVQWGFRTAWTGLVCVPATIGAAPATPAGQVAVGAGCGAAGDGLSTAISC